MRKRIAVKGTKIMTERENVNILMVDDQPSKLLSYEVILSDWGRI
jgi:hypothetical protein